MPDIHRFKHTFQNGITCTFLFEKAIHYDPANRNIFPAKQWSRRPTDEEAETLFPEYLEWSHTVHSKIAEILMVECTYVIQDSAADPPFWEFWLYCPGGKKKRIKKEIGIFDPRTIGR